VELHVGHRAGRPEGFGRSTRLDAGREPDVWGFGDVPLVVQREAERDPTLGHDQAERRVQTAPGGHVDERVLDGPELSLEHAREAAVLVVLLHASEVEGQVAIIRQEIAHHPVEYLWRWRR